MKNAEFTLTKESKKATIAVECTLFVISRDLQEARYCVELNYCDEKKTVTVAKKYYYNDDKSICSSSCFTADLKETDTEKLSKIGTVKLNYKENLSFENLAVNVAELILAMNNL